MELFSITVESTKVVVSGLTSGVQEWEIVEGQHPIGERFIFVEKGNESVCICLSGDYIEGIIRAYSYLGIE